MMSTSFASSDAAVDVDAADMSMDEMSSTTSTTGMGVGGSGTRRGSGSASMSRGSEVNAAAASTFHHQHSHHHQSDLQQPQTIRRPTRTVRSRLFADTEAADADNNVRRGDSKHSTMTRSHSPRPHNTGSLLPPAASAAGGPRQHNHPHHHHHHRSHNHPNQSHNKPSSSSSSYILKPLDLNFDFEEVSDNHNSHNHNHNYSHNNNNNNNHHLHSNIRTNDGRTNPHGENLMAMSMSMGTTTNTATTANVDNQHTTTSSSRRNEMEPQIGVSNNNNPTAAASASAAAGGSFGIGEHTTTMNYSSSSSSSSSNSSSPSDTPFTAAAAAASSGTNITRKKRHSETQDLYASSGRSLSFEEDYSSTTTNHHYRRGENNNDDDNDRHQHHHESHHRQQHHHDRRRQQRPTGGPPPQPPQFTPKRPGRGGDTSNATNRRPAPNHHYYGSGGGGGGGIMSGSLLFPPELHRTINNDNTNNSSMEDSPVADMFASPQISPSTYKMYRSPTSSSSSASKKYDRTPSRGMVAGAGGRRGGGVGAALAAASKSPRFRTLDGRIVESKNPFSPMMMHTGTDPNCITTAATTTTNNPLVDTPTTSMAAKLANVNLGPGHSPAPPPMLSLEELKQKGSVGYFYNSHLLLRQKLQKRSSASTDVVGVGTDDVNSSTSNTNNDTTDCIIGTGFLDHPTNNKNTTTNIKSGIGSLDDAMMMAMSPEEEGKAAAKDTTTLATSSNEQCRNAATLAVNALTSGNSGAAGSGEVMMMQQDDNKDRTTITNTNGEPEQFDAMSESWFTRVPSERTGRYSFTGSPIRESLLENVTTAGVTSATTGSPSVNRRTTSNSYGTPLRIMTAATTATDAPPPSSSSFHNDYDKLQQPELNVCTNLHKVRRRNKEQDVAAAAALAEEGIASLKQSQNRRGLFVSTGDGGDCEDGDDNISPTDVLSFPVLHASPSDTTTVPPAPSKKKPIRRPPVKRYTPIRHTTAPPQTPMPDRHQQIRQRRFGRSSSFEDDDDDDGGDEYMDHTDMSTPTSHHHLGRGGVNGGSGAALDYSSSGDDSNGYQQRPILPDSRAMVSGPPSSSGPSRFYSDFDVISELGNGSFGNVFKVLSRVDGCMYAIKVAHRPAKGNADRDRMLKEVYALAALSNQSDTATFHIVRYHQAWMEEHRLYIQTELCTTTLHAELKQTAPAALPIARQYKCLREVLLALEYIHKNGMCHLDIKPENIFLKNDQFKLGDFGLVSKTSSHDVEEGDSRYMSMELLSGDHADLTKSDIFSLGMTMYEVALGGNKVLPSNGPEWQSLRSTGAPPIPGTPTELYEIIQLMLRSNFHDRPSANVLLQRPQLLSDDQKMLLQERNKVLQANMALVEQRASNFRGQQQATTASTTTTGPVAGTSNQRPPPRIPRKTALTRANTWSGF